MNIRYTIFCSFKYVLCKTYEVLSSTTLLSFTPLFPDTTRGSILCFLPNNSVNSLKYKSEFKFYNYLSLYLYIICIYI